MTSSGGIVWALASGIFVGTTTIILAYLYTPLAFGYIAALITYYEFLEDSK